MFDILQFPKATLMNTTTQERWEAPFNPSSFELQLRVNYKRTQSPGLSHERLSYQNTGNNVIPLEFFVSQINTDQTMGSDFADALLDDQKFLQSLCYPESDIDYGYIGPPRVLFIWPNVITMIGRITQLNIMNRSFRSSDLTPIVMAAKLNFEEDLDERILSGDVRNNGGQHHNIMVW